MATVDPARWHELSPLLDQALDLPPADREEWLKTLGERSAELAAEVRALLAEHEALDRAGFLTDSPIVEGSQPTLAGLVVGSYRLRSPLGQGGMGSVWLADRCDGRFEGVAAVKLLNVSLIGPEGEARFRREGSLLARARHPHIAQLIDAGVSSLGQPFLVIEHIDGERIDQYCDGARLGIESRGRLFLDVLAAVAFAHANLIVHRDIKPHNVMVTREGQVKLLDFGIAKLLEPQGGELAAETLTRGGERALTPRYAAPEQLTGGSITTATDVYGLGVLLYQLLTGRHPSGPADRSPAEWIKAVVETVPARPSIAVGSDPELAARFGTTPRKLARILKGDLDNILAKALEKRPEDRYPSAESFADDLRRYLSHEPVGACGDALPYRALKFVRRHRVGVAAAAVVVTSIAVGTAGVAWQAREADRQREAARTQLGRATAANEFTTFLLSVAAPGGEKFTVGALLDQGEALIDKQFKDDDPMRAEMLATIGRQYYLADQFDKATKVLERAAAVAERTDDPAIEASAACPLALMKVFNNDRSGAEALMAKALHELPDEPQFALQRADCLIYYSNFGVATAEAAPMISRAKEALAILDKLSGPTQMKRIDAKLNLAYGLSLAHRVHEADAAYEDLVKSLEDAGRGRTIAAADVYLEWGEMHYHDNLVKMEPLVRHAVELRRLIDAQGAVAPSSTTSLALVLQELGRYDEAEALHRESVRTATQQRVRGIQYISMMELSELYLSRGELKRAIEQLAAVDPFRDDPRFRSMQGEARYAYHRGRLQEAQGDRAAARASYRRAVELFDAGPERVTNNVYALIGLSRAEQALGDGAAARDAAARAVVLSQAFVEPGSPSYLVGLSLLQRGHLERAAGAADAARATFRSAAEQLRPTLGPDHPATREALEASSR